MFMNLVGLSTVKEGVDQDEQEYCYQYGYFSGTSINVEGLLTAKVKFDFIRNPNLPKLVVGGRYNVDLSDKGYLRDIEPVEMPDELKGN